MVFKINVVVVVVVRVLFMTATYFFMAFLVEQIFTHLYTEKFLDMKYAFREAVNFVNSGENINNIIEIALF